MVQHYRKNAGDLLRLISDDFNTRKFPELVAPYRNRSASLPASDGGRWRAATNAFVFLRRLSHRTLNFGGTQQLPDQEGQNQS